jgi:hypothetical protein
LKRFVTGLVCFLSTTAAFAACSNTTPVMQEVKDSEAVVIGTVESARMVPQTWDTLDGTEYTVRVDQKVKGKQSGEIKILAERTEDTVPLVSGTQYLFFLTFNNQHWMVNKCGNSGPMNDEGPVIKQLIHLAGND